ncbi:MAG: cache domain-containing protein, partial [Lachnospiraceae bacterium]|nr:cache domain-containing protein [Lachnospiraceae bacterium]
MKAQPKKRRFRNRMITDNLIVIILAIVLIEISLTVILMSSLIKDNRKSSYELVQTMSNSFDDMWNAFKWTINGITMDTELQEVLSCEKGIVYKDGEDKLILQSVVSNAGLYSDELKQVYLYDKWGEPKVKFNRISSGSLYNYFPELELERLDESGRITTYVSGDGLIFARIIYSKSNLESIGYISCVYDESALVKRINTVVPSKNRFVLVLDKNGDIVTHNYPNESDIQIILSNLNTGITDRTEIFRVPSMGV